MRTLSSLALTGLALTLVSCSGTPASKGPVATERIAGSVPTSIVPNGAPGATDPNAPGGEGSLTSKDSKQVARTLAKVSELRGLPATRPVPGVKLERDQLVARIKDKALREYPPEALKREGQLLQMMGFAPPTFDYLGEMLKLLEAQLEGFYEPKNGTMYLAADLRGTQAQATLAHELVHALQDQKWDLKPRSKYRPGHGDETMALACLAEGDATSLMLDYVMKPDKSALDIPDEALRELMMSGMNMGDIQSVPHILRATLIAPYLEGLSFIHALRRKGDWAAVDRVWARPPVSTEQILHAEKWEANEAPLDVPAPTAAALGEGWKKDDEDTYGELGFALTFAEWMDPEEARRAAAGWGGDRTAVYSKGDQLAFADRATSKLFPALKKSFGKAAIDTAASVCFERKDTGPLFVARKDRDVVILAGPARASAGAWSSASTCATTKRWADEIIAQGAAAASKTIAR